MRLKSHLAYAYTAVLVLVLSSASPVTAARKSSQASNASAFNLSTIRIDNFGRVNANYYRGAQPTSGDYTDLAVLGVKTVINLTSDDADPNEKAMVERSGMAYVQIPMTTRVPPTGEELAAFLSIVNDPVSQPVYVHCVGGRHRTGVMTAVYRMTHDGWTGDQAFREMKQYKFGLDFLHPEFKQFVYGYRVDPAPAVARANTAG